MCENDVTQLPTNTFYIENFLSLNLKNQKQLKDEDN